ncbi:RNA 2',3'-cyclic phosphodiesterase [Legionella pneumophila]|uniref:RNA 2',3'-cyclic phosphodiesterase n=1 Tax=Legionella pneumophila subsp. pascullei TaxID=91890 RepID=A0AAX2IZJ3_LEGPN|nr:RNA 2',3'-cyclic phosphodiesterase [Legionella pneumophila]AMP88947.1 2'-5' RNA ligase [Legionella pneumophila subsp. pascullei]AMP93385.1 2'-5' RNA ligase [Legionella pneumophila subsp. pascullei]AMP96351.1 2'-5' RNA ligase [Legionella pneumophila subsp. pascullei]SQG91321.1 RNA ligase/cyclic nucleotide phosphodiesterase [Legionella pneumophila subsp. pascullei]VEH07867.1 RNA ligase/cyclic nucleotide phosphodiesterase [Legionella pneumophila subsp. pascullei]
MNAIRAFFAISLPPSVQDNIWNNLESLKQMAPVHSIRWTKPIHLHITLQFLQKLETEHIQFLTERVSNQLNNIKQFDLELGFLEWFPSPKNPRLISLSVGPQDRLRDLSRMIGQVIDGLNYPVEKRPFRGHLTVGRVVNFSSKLYQLLQMKFPLIPPVPIDKFFLIESRPDKKGSNYFPLAQFDLTR